MKRRENNIIVTARNIDGKPGFAVILSLSGVEERMCTRRHNGLLYGVLENGITLGALRRWEPKPPKRRRDSSRRGRRRCTHLINDKQRLLRDIDTYLKAREILAENPAKTPMATGEPCSLATRQIAA